MRKLKNWMRFPVFFKPFALLLMLCTILLSMAGIYLIEMLEPGLGKRQLAGMGAGILMMLFFSVVNIEMLCRNMRWSIYLLTVTMLFMVNILGAVSGGAARWLEIGGFRFQPSEVGKLLLILFFSERFSEKAEKVSQWGFLLRTAFLMGIPLISILEEPDLSTTIVTAWIFICVWFAAGLDYKLIGKFLAVIIPAGALFLFLVTRPGQELLNDYQYRRIMAWLHPEEWAAESYQQMYSMMAIGSGGALGRLGEQDEAVTVIGSGFLPEPHTDFIMAAAGQEWGFAGCSMMILALMAIVFCCLRRGMQVKSMTGRLICCGVAAWIGGQGFVNLGVVSGMLPNTGLTFPFVSYGLTSMVSLYMGVGIVLSVR